MKTLSLSGWLCAIGTILSSIGGEPAWAGPRPGPPPGPCPHQLRFVLAEYHVWHGSQSHSSAFCVPWLPNCRPYDSRDPAVIARHIQSAKAMGIDGFVVDWYGPDAPLANQEDRQFMDEAMQELRDVAEAEGFWIALLYDEGTLTQGEVPEEQYMERVISDLRDAEERYFSSPAYLRLEGRPALFVFPYPHLDPHLDWAQVRAALDGPVTLLDQDPNPEDPAHDALFDGFFAWVQPGSRGWDPLCRNWGEDYLRWFYATMRKAPYRSKIAVGGLWPGFDDTLAPWGQGRCMSRQGGKVWDETCRLAEKTRIAMIATWNDFEEGTDVELGVRMVVDMESPVPEVLVRSSPLQVTWNPARGARVLQVYRDGGLVYEHTHFPGVYLSFESRTAYEIKVWDGTLALAKAVKIRGQDPIPGVVPIEVE